VRLGTISTRNWESSVVSQIEHFDRASWSGSWGWACSPGGDAPANFAACPTPRRPATPVRPVDESTCLVTLSAWRAPTLGGARGAALPYSSQADKARLTRRRRPAVCRRSRSKASTSAIMRAPRPAARLRAGDVSCSTGGLRRRPLGSPPPAARDARHLTVGGHTAMIALPPAPRRPRSVLAS
jgi:hypothetical protein